MSLFKEFRRDYKYINLVTWGQTTLLFTLFYVKMNCYAKENKTDSGAVFFC